MRSLQLLLCFAGFLAIPAKHGTHALSAQIADTIIALWPDGIPCENNNEIIIELDPDIGRLQKRVHTPEIHIYRPFKRGKKDVAVLICPGGGYYLHAWDWEGVAFAQALNQLGITAAVLSYRLPAWETEQCRSEVALADAQRAMQILRSRAKTEGYDPDKIGIMGFSAGGHLAASASVHTLPGNEAEIDRVAFQPSRPDFSILVYPVISMDTIGTGHAGSRYNLIGRSPSPEMVEYYSLETQVDSLTPPTILIHAADDVLVPVQNSISYFQALVEQDVAAEMHVYPTGGHGFGMANAFGGKVRNWWSEVLAYLANY